MNEDANVWFGSMFSLAFYFPNFYFSLNEHATALTTVRSTCLPEGCLLLEAPQKITAAEAIPKLF